MAFSEQFFVIRTWLVISHSYRLATASNAEFKTCFEIEAQSSGGDIGAECLQSDDSYSLDAFGDIDGLIADLFEFATTPPRTTEC